MEDNRINIAKRITDEATITLTTEEYRNLADAALRFEILYNDVKARIDDGAKSYDRVNDALVLHVLGLAYYKHENQTEEIEI